MAHRALVTVGTDGSSDFVQVSDGTKYMLGAVSVLKFVAELAPGSWAARKALDEFLSDGHAMLSVDAEKMWAMLAPRRPRMSSAISLIPALDRTPITTRQGTMADTSFADKTTKEAIENQVTRIEGQISLLTQHAKEASPGSISADSMKNQIAGLRDLVSWLRRPSPYGNQSQNGTYYGLPNVGPGGIKASNRASYDNFKRHTEMAETIIARVNETNGKIDRLVAAGKKFDAPRAKQDLHKIASKVAEIAQSVDLAVPWVGNDLADLSKATDDIHGLFAPATI